MNGNSSWYRAKFSRLKAACLSVKAYESINKYFYLRDLRAILFLARLFRHFLLFWVGRRSLTGGKCPKLGYSHKAPRAIREKREFIFYLCLLIELKVVLSAGPAPAIPFGQRFLRPLCIHSITIACKSILRHKWRLSTKKTPNEESNTY